jgi:hypothetical protein
VWSHVQVEHLKAMPVSLPFSSGRTLPTALAAPVDEGIMLPAAALPPLQSFLLGPSTVFWVAVVAWTVVMRPSLMPKLALITCKQPTHLNDDILRRVKLSSRYYYIFA